MEQTLLAPKFVVTTTKSSALSIRPQSRIKEKTIPWSGPVLLAICILLGISFIGTRHNWRVRWPILLPAALTVLAVLCSSSGGGSSSTRSGPPVPPPGATRAGTSAIVVTDTSGKVSHAATAQLTLS